MGNSQLIGLRFKSKEMLSSLQALAEKGIEILTEILPLILLVQNLIVRFLPYLKLIGEVIYFPRCI